MADRRTVLKSVLAASALCVWDAPIRFAFASVPTDRRLVFVILRGALDGLAAVPPHGDPDYASVRGNLALTADGTNAIHNLDGQFGLNPGLVNLKGMWDARELVVFHNIASPYRDRSHFDGQNVLETGGSATHAMSDGWLNRALKPIGLDDGNRALAIAASPPLLMSGPTKVSSWLPATMPRPDADFLRRIRALYAGDAELAASLDRALATEAEAEAAMDDKPASPQAGKHKGQYGNLTPLFTDAGKFLAREDGPRVVVFETGGWDTHVGEGAGEGQLARRLSALDAALQGLKNSLGPAWKKTAVMMATEFGRTVAPNGNGGTDHGTAGAAFVFGGAIRGGVVKAEWVGLKPSVLKDGRDLPPRSDLRAMFKGVLSDHMRVARRDLDSMVFPDSNGIVPASDLIAV